jgi:hypothetical protein
MRTGLISNQADKFERLLGKGLYHFHPLQFLLTQDKDWK